MARIPKKSKRELRREKLTHSWLHDQRSQKVIPHEASFESLNGGGCVAHNIRCEGCGAVVPGGEQYKSSELQVTPCFRCGCETALYEHQLR